MNGALAPCMAPNCLAPRVRIEWCYCPSHLDYYLSDLWWRSVA